MKNERGGKLNDEKMNEVRVFRVNICNDECGGH